MIKYFEDFVVGGAFECGAYEVTADEIVAFARQYDPQPFHLDQAAADASVFRGLTASGFHTVAMQGALIHASPLAGAAVIAGLGWDEVRFTRPVRAGDILSLRCTCLEVRASATKPNRGVVRNLVVLRNQHGEDVLSSVHNVLLERRPTAPEV